MTGKIRVSLWNRLASRRGAIVAASLVIAAGFGVVVLGGTDPVPAETGGILQPGDLKNLLPLEEIIARARAKHDGELIEAELSKRNGIDDYEIEILDKGGKVWEMHFDAKTGTLVQPIEEKDGNKAKD